MVLWFMAAKRPVHYGVGFGREAAKLSIFEVDFGREEVTCPFLTCFWPRAANLSISSTFFEDMSNMVFLKTFKKKL